jgi:hypothetical protein
MGIYNNIHDVVDDKYYYCSVNDCPCHSPDYYDSSRNLNFVFDNDDKYDHYNFVDDKYDHYNLVDDKYYNDKYDGGFTGELN